jgi:hypothetical protein
MFDQASKEQLQKWVDVVRWYFFTFEVRIDIGGYAPGEFEKWIDKVFPLYRTGGVDDNPPSDELLDWYSRAVTMHEAADEPQYRHPLRSDKNPKE